MDCTKPNGDVSSTRFDVYVCPFDFLVWALSSQNGCLFNRVKPLASEYRQRHHIKLIKSCNCLTARV